MVGRRIEVAATDSGYSLEGVEPGDYWKFAGEWYGACPDAKHPDEFSHRIVLAGFGRHEVTEHDDGTITVSPSILVSAPWGKSQAVFEFYHGFLERGIWRSV